MREFEQKKGIKIFNEYVVRTDGEYWVYPMPEMSREQKIKMFEEIQNVIPEGHRYYAVLQDETITEHYRGDNDYLGKGIKTKFSPNTKAWMNEQASKVAGIFPMIPVLKTIYEILN